MSASDVNPYAGEYVCTLDEATLAKAQLELHEDPKQRRSAMDALRQWILEQPHLRCRTDDHILISFLRGAKFSQLRAREMIEGNLALLNTMPQWFRNVDPLDSKIMTIIEAGYCIPLPKRDENGSRVLLYRTGVVDPNPKVIPMSVELKAGIIIGTLIAEEEATQVNGFVFIFDFTGITARHMTRWSMDDMKNWSKAWQKNMPGRFKAFHYYNAGTVFEVIMSMVKAFLSTKFKERIHTHENLESLYKKVSVDLLPEEYTPDDYKGPTAGKIQDLIKDYKTAVSRPEFRARCLYNCSERFGLDESKRLKDAPQASFRKLNME